MPPAVLGQLAASAAPKTVRMPDAVVNFLMFEAYHFLPHVDGSRLMCVALG